MIKKIDIIYFREEPPSFCAAAFEDLTAHGITACVIPMPQNADSVLASLRQSHSDAIFLISPFQFRDFLATNYNAIKAIGKPIISFINEHVWGNSFNGYREFEESKQWADFYLCSQDSDTQQSILMGRNAVTMRGGNWVATNLFREGPPLGERIPKLCFIGHTRDYSPGIYSERRRLLSALTEHDLVDILSIPRSRQTAHLVAQAYSSYAGVFCPPANGRCHSIRVMEAAACGALVVEVQPLDHANIYLRDGKHRIGLHPGLSAEELVDRVRALQFVQCQAIATAGCRKVRSFCNPMAAWDWVLRESEQALGLKRGITSRVKNLKRRFFRSFNDC
jgi:hypothetical protein